MGLARSTAMHWGIVALALLVTEWVDYRPFAQCPSPHHQHAITAAVPDLIAAEVVRKNGRKPPASPTRLHPLGYSEVVASLELVSIPGGVGRRFRMALPSHLLTKQSDGTSPSFSDAITVYVLPSDAASRVAAPLLSSLQNHSSRFVIIVEVDGSTSAPSAQRLTGPFASSYFYDNYAGYLPTATPECEDTIDGVCALNWVPNADSKDRSEAWRTLEKQSVRFRVQGPHAAATIAKAALSLIREGRQFVVDPQAAECRTLYWLLAGHPPNSLATRCKKLRKRI